MKNWLIHKYEIILSKFSRKTVRAFLRYQCCCEFAESDYSHSVGDNTKTNSKLLFLLSFSFQLDNRSIHNNIQYTYTYNIYFNLLKLLFIFKTFNSNPFLCSVENANLWFIFKFCIDRELSTLSAYYFHTFLMFFFSIHLIFYTQNSLALDINFAIFVHEYFRESYRYTH